MPLVARDGNGLWTEEGMHTLRLNEDSFGPGLGVGGFCDGVVGAGDTVGLFEN
jgi:hypothetical protein